MSIPREPRQQMINIMYLVLIALLALNVSSEILNAFKLLDEGITDSKGTLSQKVSATMQAFQEQLKKDKKGQEYFDTAQEAIKESKNFNGYLEEMKQELIEFSGGFDENGEVKELGNQEAPTQFMVKNKKKAYELAEKIEEQRGRFLGLIDKLSLAPEKKKALRQEIMQSMPLKVKELPANTDKPDWAHYNFYQMPLMAVVTMLNKFQNDTKNTESLVVDKLFGLTGAENVVYDKFKVAVVPNSRTFLVGEDLEADIYMAASSSQSKATIRAGGRALNAGADGVASYKANVGNSPGKRSLNVEINATDGFGESITLKETFEYNVVPRPDHAAIVSPTKMNVFYKGVPNPVSVAVTGINASKVKASMSGGGALRADGGAGNYTADVTSVKAGSKVTVSLSAPKPGGGTFTGGQEFRVKRIPDPTPQVGGKNGGKMKSGEFKAQTGIVAKLKDFDFDAKFKVLGYEMMLAERGQDLMTATGSGAGFGGQVASLMGRAKPGSIYYFDNIQVQGPDGVKRNLGSIAFSIR